MPPKPSDRLSAAQDWKNRLATARSNLPKGIGQQAVIEYIVEQKPELNKLTNFYRWHNAWQGRVADTEIIPLVEQAAEHFSEKSRNVTSRLKRQKLGF